MNNWQIDTDELFNHERSTQAKTLATVASVLLLIFSAVTSWAFFALYAYDVFTFMSPTLAPFLAGLVGVVVFEGMTLVWRYLRAHHANTHAQMAIASWGATLALSGGLLVTVVFFALQTELLASVVDDTLLRILSLAGGLLMIAGVSGGFLLWHLYSVADGDHERNTQRATLSSMQHSAQLKVSQMTTDRVLRDTAGAVMKNLPEYSQRQARQNQRAYYESVFAGDPTQLGEDAQQNGHR